MSRGIAPSPPSRFAVRNHQRRLRARRLWLLLGLALAGCSDEGSTPPPPAPPEPARAALSGQLALAGRLTDAAGRPQGMRRLLDADGVLVRLHGPDGFADSTRTVHGRYHFTELDPGDYIIEAAVVPEIDAARLPAVVGEVDVQLADTLLLGPQGDVLMYPNPSPEEGIGVEFTASTAQRCTVEVRTLAGELLWSYAMDVPPGYYHVHWAGHDAQAASVPAGAYWTIVRVDGGCRCGLVFWPGRGHDDDDGHCGPIDAGGLVIAHHHEILVTCRGQAVDGALVAAPGEEGHGLDVRFLNAALEHELAVADSCTENRLTWSVADTTVAKLRPVAGRMWAVRLVGIRAGQTTAVLQGWHGAQADVVSPPIPIRVEAP